MVGIENSSEEVAVRLRHESPEKHCEELEVKYFRQNKDNGSETEES
jgi:hypothetical protein